LFHSARDLLNEEPRKPGRERLEMALEQEDMIIIYMGAVLALSLDPFFKLFSWVPAFLIENVFDR
jgi:hypothetical protein